VIVFTTEPPTAGQATMQGLADPVYETH